MCQKPHGLQWLMFFGIHPFSSETDFLIPDFCLSLIATYHVSLPLISQGGHLRVPPLFSAISTLTVTSKGVSCNNCLLGKHTYIHQPCYVLPRDWKRHSDQSPCLTGSHCTHSASLGRFVPHHASAVWRKAPLHRTLFRLNLEKKMAAPISMLTTSTIDGCDFDTPLQLFGNP